MQSSDLTASDLLAAATEVLKANGYAHDDKPLKDWPASSRVFEDVYGVVALVVHDTWRSLAQSWREDQGRFVELLAKTIDRTDMKAWEGYLVLLTPAVPATSNERQHAREIRYDTMRVRKLVATGIELNTLSDVERALFSLLPLPEADTTLEEANILASLPPLLAEHGIPAETTRQLVEAFEGQSSLLKALSSGKKSA